MTDCKHGLPTNYCALCNRTVTVTVNSPRYPTCCHPDCTRSALKEVAGLPLCPDHYHRLETQIAKVHTDLTGYTPVIEWVYFVQIDNFSQAHGLLVVS